MHCYMSHHNFNYILLQKSDLVGFGGSFNIPVAYGSPDKWDDSGNYLIIENATPDTAADISYTPGTSYPAWVLNEFPDAPNGDCDEAYALVKTTGAINTAWASGIID